MSRLSPYCRQVLALATIGLLACGKSSTSPDPDPTPNQPPTVSITAPVSGTAVPEGALTVFSGTASDPEDGNLSSSISWSSNLDGALGSGTMVSATLSVGTHTITASVSDVSGLAAAASIVVTVVPNAPPTVTITSPTDTMVTEGTDLTFTGTADDEATVLYNTY